MFLLGALLIANAQVPSYVPTNGLVSAYTFNGNANNMFGNGTNGVVSNATLTTDRFGISNNAYEFNGVNSNIDLGINQGINSIMNDFTISYWVYKTNNLLGNVISSYSNQSGSYWRFISNIDIDSVSSGFLVGGGGGNWQSSITKSSSLNLNNWINVTIIRNSTNLSTYINGILSNSSSVSSSSINNPTTPAATTKIGYTFPSNDNNFFKGKIDDLYFWNRALTSSEITDLYNDCQLVIKQEPMNQSLNIGQQAQFTIVANDNLSTYQWQADMGTGFQTLSNAGQYTGAQNDTLLVSNLTMSNNNQNFRCIVKSGSCLDTSNLVVLKVIDNVGIEISNIENIKVFPNPSSTQVIIDNGNYSAMGSFTAKVVNASGQQVFQSVINQQQFVIDANTMGGAGVYTLYITDSTNKVVGVKKIVLQ